MELFELLFILIFILFPILDQLFRRGKKGGQLPESKLPRDEGRVDPRAEEREPVSAADMVPDDLWAILTGEKRPTRGGGGTATRTREAPAEQAPWSGEPELEGERLEPEPSRWRDQGDFGWREPQAEPEPDLEPVSLEYEGPEAYSLEPVEIQPVSLERPLLSPEVRHRRFHEKIDAPRPRRRVRKSPIARALENPDSLRQALVLREVLGKPRGLE